MGEYKYVNDPFYYLYFLDFETQQGLEGKIIYGHIIQTDRRYNIIREYSVHSKEEFIDLFMNAKPGYWIAHNGGRFDFPKVFTQLLKAGAELDPEQTVIKNGRIFSAFFIKPLAIMKDSFPLFLMALKKFKKAFKLNIGKSTYNTISYIDLFRIDKKDFDKLKEYCRQDVLTLIEGFKVFERTLMSHAKLSKRLYEYLSLPQLSMDILKHSIKNFQKKVPPMGKMRQAYSGGRTEIFKMYEPEKTLYYYDANSLYPTVMTMNEYPVAPYHQIKDIDAHGIVKIKLYKDQPKYYIPPIPVKIYLPYRSFDPTTGLTRITRRPTKLYFPDLETTSLMVTTQEARLLERLGYRFHVEYGIGSYDTEPLFEILKEWYELRKENKHNALNLTLKLLMNSAYGKFGQKRQIEAFDPEHMNFETRSKFLYNNIIIASHITANARIFMYETMLKVGLEHIYYTDTDSIITDRRLQEVDDDLLGPNLGQFKQEYEIHKYLALLPKTYCLQAYEVEDNKVIRDKEKFIAKAKGFKLNNVNSEQDFLNKLSTGEINSSVPSLKSIIKYGMNESFNRSHIIKRIQHTYDKRKIDQETLDTEPFSTTELSQVIAQKWSRF